jgi:hypothetical protein
MKTKWFFIFGLLAVLLALGLVFVSCDNGTNGDGDESITVNITGLSVDKEVAINRGWIPPSLGHGFVIVGGDREATADSNGRVSVEFDLSYMFEQQLGNEERPIYISLEWWDYIPGNSYRSPFTYLSKDHFIWKPQTIDLTYPDDFLDDDEWSDRHRN